MNIPRLTQGGIMEVVRHCPIGITSLDFKGTKVFLERDGVTVEASSSGEYLSNGDYSGLQRHIVNTAHRLAIWPNLLEAS